ncbi:MAG: non-canonical purine NTP pyrophosphatase, partial [Brevinematia bacterium]
PVFIPEGYDKTFSELGPEIKNKISHRRIALTNLAEKIKKILNQEY